MGVRVVLTAVAAAVVLLSGCAGESGPPAASTEVSKADWQTATDRGLWPFTADEGVLTCRAPDWVTFTADGTEYALSDNARWVGHYPSVSPILVNSYVEIGEQRQPVPTPFDSVTNQGLKLCP